MFQMKAAKPSLWLSSTKWRCDSSSCSEEPQRVVSRLLLKASWGAFTPKTEPLWSTFMCCQWLDNRRSTCHYHLSRLLDHAFKALFSGFPAIPLDAEMILHQSGSSPNLSSSYNSNQNAADFCTSMFGRSSKKAVFACHVPCLLFQFHASNFLQPQGTYFLVIPDTGYMLTDFDL